VSPEIDKIFGNRVRVRACGICWKGDNLLMVNHVGITRGSFWAPPGGGVEFGDSVKDTLRHEFREETGLEVEAGQFLCVCEYLKSPLHAIELFFEVEIRGGSLIKGFDPEMAPHDQAITEVAFLQYRQILDLSPGERHGLFEIFRTEKALKSASGYWKI
jgi:8-oxo-dGTP diphosphatase